MKVRKYSNFKNESAQDIDLNNYEYVDYIQDLIDDVSEYKEDLVKIYTDSPYNKNRLCINILSGYKEDLNMKIEHYNRVVEILNYIDRIKSRVESDGLSFNLKIYHHDGDTNVYLYFDIK